MKPRDITLALLLVAIWGANFTAIKVALEHTPPFALAALRFAAVAFPAVLWVARPRLPWRWLAAYALCTSFGQFALLFVAMRSGMPAGLASVVLQVAAPFTVLFSAWLLAEPVRRHQLLGMALAALGLVVLGQHALQQQAHAGAALTGLGFALTVAAGASWALGNVVNKHIAHATPTPILGLVVWGGLLVAPLFALCALWLEGADVFTQVTQRFTWQDAAAIAYIAYLASIVGYVIWGNLLARYPASSVAPLSLLVPPIGLGVGASVLGEALHPQQWLGIAVVMAALLLIVFGARWRSWRTRPA